MMKKISLRNLRISSHHKDVDDDDPQCGGAYEQPNLPTTTGRGDFSPRLTRRDDIHSPGTVRRKEKRGIFKTLKQKFSVNFKGKRDIPSIVDDDSSSDARDEEAARHHYRYGLRSPDKYKRATVRSGYESGEVTPGSVGRRRKAPMPDPPSTPERVQSHPTKEEISKSEESTSPSEDNTAMFPSDAEYGHASAPVMVEELLDDAQDQTDSSMVVGATKSVASYSGGNSEHGSECGGPSSSTNHLQTHQQSEAQRQGSRSVSPAPPSIDQLEGFEPYESDSNSLSGMTCRGGLVVPLRPDLISVYNEVKEAPKTWSLTKELFKLSKYGWYWGPITRVEAEEKLNNQPDGAFLVRDSSDERYLLSLSFRSHYRTLHTRIEHCNGVFSFYAQPESEGFCSIVELIEHSMSDSQAGVFCYSRARVPGAPSFPVRLTKPLSRFTQVRSLQYLCRFVIRQYTRFDHIQKLPLPTRIKGWLEENQY